MKKCSMKWIAILAVLCLLLSVTGCRKLNGEKSSGEWISDTAYYYFDENGNWVEVQDLSVFNNTENGSDNTASESKGGKEVDSSQYQTLVDYCGNDDFDKVFEKKNMTKESLNSDVLEDDWRFRKLEQKDGIAYLTYKVNGIAEFFVEYSYGVGDRYANKIQFFVSKDNKSWTEVTAQDEIYMLFNGTSWVRTRAYFGNIDPKNQYLKIQIGTGGKFVFNPNINTVQINGLTESALAELGMYSSKLPAKTVYIDSQNGKDTNAGTEKAPLKSLYAASKQVYSPGSKILLKSGCQFSGSLNIIGSGIKGKPITITSYGSGAKPVINARGGSAVEAYGEYITVTNLKITNKSGKAGVKITACKPNASHGITVTKCDFEDINTNFTSTDYGASGVRLEAAGREPAWFDGVNISDNTFNHVARCGITLASDWTGKVTNQTWGARNDISKGEWFGSKNVVIQNNKLEKIGGDGIILFGCDGAVVQHNVVANSGLFKNMGEIHWAAIWCHSCNNCIFQYNEVYGNSGQNNGYDLQAFDCDIANKDCVFQYNYSHDNQGGFMLICANDATDNAQTTGTVVRYNLSVNDGTEGGMIFDITGSCYDSKIYNNTIYVGNYNQRLVNFVHYDDGPTHSKNTVFSNNIFYAKKGLSIDFGITKLQNATFQNNVFYNIPEPSDSRITVKNSYTADPNLVSPGATGTGLEKVAAKYKPESGYALTGGVAISNNGGKDLLGKEADNKLLGALSK